MSEEQDLLQAEQQTLMFYGKPIVVVRLPDGRPGVVLRFLCENLQIDTAAPPGVEASSPGWKAWKKSPT